MAINWDKFVRRDRATLLWIGIFNFISSVALFYLYFGRETIRSRDDITFITGPFKEYSWIDYGMNGASLTFKLQNYSNRFKIEAQFFHFLPKDKLESIPSGETLTIGIPNSFVKHLNKPKDLFFVYSIASKGFSYLDLRDTIKEQNSLGPLVAAFVFVVLGYYFVRLGQRAKERLHFGNQGKP